MYKRQLRIYARARMRASNLALDRPLALVDESVALLDLALSLIHISEPTRPY